MENGKKSSGLIVFVVILSLLVVGLGGYIVYDKFLSNNNKTEEKEKETNNKDNKESNNEEITNHKNELAVMEVINAIMKNISTQTKTFSFTKTWDEVFPIYLPNNAKSAIALNKSYGLYSFANQLNQEWKDLLLSKELTQTITNTLNDLGFESYEKVENLMGPKQYINNKTNLICLISGPSDPYYMACGHTSWVSSDDIKLINDLSEAYKAKEGNYLDVIYASTKDIVNSCYTPYQRIFANTGDYVALFYKTNPDSNWIYFSGTQSGFNCKDFNSDDLKKAFAGEKCFDSSNNPTEIKP